LQTLLRDILVFIQKVVYVLILSTRMLLFTDLWWLYRFSAL
jgi:hypothetical protein